MPRFVTMIMVDLCQCHLGSHHQHTTLKSEVIAQGFRSNPMTLENSHESYIILILYSCMYTLLNHVTPMIEHFHTHNDPLLSLQVALDYQSTYGLDSSVLQWWHW